MKLKNELNDMQYKAAVHEEGPILILAGAGSGKTRVLTYRIAHLVENCFVSPRNILAITFTNKAAKEMSERVANLLGGELSGMWISTFHSACGRILRRDAERLGFTSSFIIYDESEVQSVIKDCMKKLEIDEKRFPVKSIRSVISKAKDEMYTPDDYLKTVDAS
ncbi:MAG: UvrD-helicase domain-containing protein, partial [Clostridia bacterium]|nr:UvrD-helicase domain-containing protein [Clostridia bacterium]